VSARASCTLCLRPRIACICRWITPVANEVEVLILQHPLEVRQAKGSARLLHLSLARSQLLTGEVFDVRGLLADAQGDADFRHNLLLYPDTPQAAAEGLLAAPQLTPEMLREPARLRLVVLDGTWRKSRKMLYLNPLLQQLPRLSLQPTSASNYLIRRAHRPGQLSTLEATCAALAQLEGGRESLARLLAAFAGFVAQQMGWRPGESRTKLL